MPVQFCATREKLQGACLKFIQVVISLVCFVFLFCSVLVFLVDDHSPCHGWLVSCAKKKVCQLISVHFVEEREHCDRRVIRGGGEVKKKQKTHTHTHTEHLTLFFLMFHWKPVPSVLLHQYNL